MGHKGRRIGIVLAQTPTYSETFLVSKIKGLVECGFLLTVFTGSGRNSNFSLCRKVNGYSIPSIAWCRPLKIFAVLLFTSIRCPVRTLRFVNQEFAMGTSFADVIRHLFISAHILPHKLDYLHFGFSVLGVGRESLGRAMKVRLSTSFRGFDVSLFPLSRHNVYHRLWRVLDKVHTISDDLYDTALSLGLSDSIPVAKITPAIDVDRFLFPNRGFKVQESLRILTVARLHWKKGLEVALDAMAILKRMGISFRYTVVGKGAEWDRLAFARQQLDLSEEVLFLGALPHDRVVELMRENDIYIQPSLQEGFCNSVIEAQASGMLCIVSDAEGLSENVLHGRTGWVVPKWDTRALAKKIVDVNGLARDEKERISKAAAVRVSEYFRTSVQKSLFEEFFTS